jgi:hypothetical protein
MACKYGRVASCSRVPVLQRCLLVFNFGRNFSRTPCPTPETVVKFSAQTHPRPKNELSLSPRFLSRRPCIRLHGNPSRPVCTGFHLSHPSNQFDASKISKTIRDARPRPHRQCETEKNMVLVENPRCLYLCLGTPATLAT